MDCFSTPLSGEALLHINGPDTLSFLQGQTTCDTRGLDAFTALLGAYCTPRGRVICDFLLVQLGDDHYALRMRRDILQPAATTLAKYIVFSRAVLDAKDHDWQVFACWGSGAAPRVAEICGSIPGQRHAVVAGNGLTVVQMDDEGMQFECFLDQKLHPDAPTLLSGVRHPAGENRWRALQIASGIARIEASTVECFTPQMLNYDLTGHISFNKGCYTGQEVVARLHYRGKSKRRLYLARVTNPVETPAGTEVYTTAGGQSVGTIVNSVAANESAVALVAATADGVAAGLHLGSPGGPELTIGSLPYRVEAD